MPDWVVDRVAEALNDRAKAVKGSRILILGLSYKANVDDDRESPTYLLMEKLEARGAQVDYHDDYFPVIRETREHPHFAGRESVPLTPEALQTYDCVLIATAHKDVDYALVAAHADLIVDTRNAMAAIPTKPGQVWKA